MSTTKYPLFAFNVKEVITREDNKPYLIRRTLLRLGKWFSIKIHNIVQSDDACAHSHPWPFISIILKGGYYEWQPVKESDWSYDNDDYDAIFKNDVVDYDYFPDGTLYVKKWYGPGSILYRQAKSIHRLELVENTTCTTLVFTFKVIRKWGFYTKLGFIYWRDYTKQKHC